MVSWKTLESQAFGVCPSPYNLTIDVDTELLRGSNLIKFYAHKDGYKEKFGYDAVINVRFMTSAIMGGAAEILAYGTAVKLK